MQSISLIKKPSSIPVWVLGLFFLAGGCATTHVQTAGDSGGNPTGPEEEERRFFRMLSARDRALAPPTYGQESYPATGSAYGGAAVPLNGERNASQTPGQNPGGNGGNTVAAGVVPLPVPSGRSAGPRANQSNPSDPSQTPDSQQRGLLNPNRAEEPEVPPSERRGLFTADNSRTSGNQNSTEPNPAPATRIEPGLDQNSRTETPVNVSQNVNPGNGAGSTQPPLVMASTLPGKEKPVTESRDSYFPEPQASATQNRSADPDLVVTPIPVPLVAGSTGPGGSGAGTTPASSTAANGEDFYQVGTASWYGKDFDGRKTASGEEFDSRRLTAAHRELPLGSIILVRNMENGKEVMVTVNDRGPYVDGRILDMSEYGAELLGYRNRGLATVGIKLVRQGDQKSRSEGVTAVYYGEGAGKDRGLVNASGSGQEAGNVSSRLSAASTESVEIEPEREMNSYSVQVGLFEDKANALSMKRYLDAYGAPVHVLQRGSLYVVKVGEYQSRYAAEQMKYQLVADGYSGFISEPSN